MRTKLLFQIPFQCYLTGPSKDSLVFRTTFEVSPFSVSLKLLSREDNIYELENGEKNERYFTHIDYLEYALTPLCNEIAGKLDSQTLATQEKERTELFRTLLMIVNRTLQSIRNFVAVPHIQVLNPETKDAEAYMALWDLRVLASGEEHPIFPPTSAFALAMSGKSPLEYLRVQDSMNVPNLNVRAWPDIEEALQDNSDPPPEKEFFINAIEFLGVRNFRMALLESIICLEIVLSQYLRAYLSIRKSLSTKRINDFLTPGMGLTARLTGLLDLTLSPEDLSDIDVNKIIQAVKWRNEIVHQTGRLPQNVKEEALRDSIGEVLGLVLRLAQLRDRINSSPELEQIAQRVSEDNSIPVPTIFGLARHSVLVEIQFMFKELPSEKVLKNVAQALGEELGRRDRKFKPDKHLFIRFLKFPQETVARWHAGNLEFADGKPS
jgi:hypothetical protein